MIGRPYVEFDRYEARRLLLSGLPVTKVAPIVGVARNTLQRHKRAVLGLNEIQLLPAFRSVPEEIVYRFVGEGEIEMDSIFKDCNVCGETKLTDKEFYFKKTQGTYRGTCKTCYRGYAREYHHAHYAHLIHQDSLMFWPFVRKLDEGDRLIGAINEMVPKTLSEQVRADVCQEILTAILAGEITEREINVPAYVSKIYKTQEFDRFKHISLDDTRPGNRPLLERLCVENWAEQIEQAWEANRLL